MSYTLSIVSDSLDDLYATISALQGKATVEISAGATEPVKKPRKTKEAAPAQPVQEKVVEMVAKQNVEASAAEPAPAVIAYKDVAAATLELVGKKGKPAALAILKEFNVETAPKLSEDKWAEYLDAVKTEMDRL